MAEDPNYIKEVKRFIQDIPKAKYGNDWPTCQKITHVDTNVAVMFE